MRLFLIGLFITFFFLFSLINTLKAQESENSMPHHIGIPANNFVQHIFKPQPYAYDMNYRYVRDGHGYRTGLKFYQSKSHFQIGTKLGYEKVLKNYGDWGFRYGVDLWYFLFHHKLNNSMDHKFGVSPFIGIYFHISDHFILSTEPGLYFIYEHYIDNDWDKGNTINNYEYGFNNIGQVQLIFRF
jgi:hypothetical protein